MPPCLLKVAATNCQNYWQDLIRRWSAREFTDSDSAFPFSDNIFCQTPEDENCDDCDVCYSDLRVSWDVVLCCGNPFYMIL